MDLMGAELELEKLSIAETVILGEFLALISDDRLERLRWHIEAERRRPRLRDQARERMRRWRERRDG